MEKKTKPSITYYLRVWTMNLMVVGVSYKERVGRESIGVLCVKKCLTICLKTTSLGVDVGEWDRRGLEAWGGCTWSVLGDVVFSYIISAANGPLEMTIVSVHCKRSLSHHHHHHHHPPSART